MIRATLTFTVVTAIAATASANVWISEVLQRNDRLTTAPYLDEDGQRHGWLELENDGPSAIDLTGWELSVTGPAGQWTLPGVLLGPGQTLLIWASGKDRSDPLGPLHSSFALMGRSSLELRDDQGALVDSIPTLEVPVDHSMGRVAGEESFYDTPSPGVVNDPWTAVPYVVLPRYLSLEVGRPETLLLRPPPPGPVTWSSSLPSVTVDQSGEVFAAQTQTNLLARATISAAAGPVSESSDVTIVDWVAHLSSLKVVATPNVTRILGTDGNRLIFSIGYDLYESTDGLETKTLLGPRPAYLYGNASLLTTPFGYFLRTGADIYRSADLVNWSLTFSAGTHSLRDGFAFHYDAAAQLGTVYVGEYSTVSSSFHRVFRGSFPDSGGETWETILEFQPLDDWTADETVLDAVRHIHTVRVDPYTGNLWVGTGDKALHSRILASTNRGDDFELIGMGSPDWRTLSIWFTEDYVYWNMDTTAPQSIWRLARSDVGDVALQPATPELSSGMTTPGIQYYVTSDPDGQLPDTVGGHYIETVARPLDAAHRVRPLDDPLYDRREEVAQLAAGSHWFQMWVDDPSGNRVSLVSCAPEGAIRDFRGRVFGIRELTNGTADVQELVAITPVQPTFYTPYVQWQPLAQDALGNIYFAGRDTPHAIYQTRLEWQPNPALQPPSPPISCGLGPEVALALLGIRAIRRRRSCT